MTDVHSSRTEFIPAFVVSGRGITTARRAEDVSLINEMHNLQLIDGSLNLISKTPVYLNSETAFLRGYCSFWFAAIRDVPVVLYRWAGCPAHVFEVFADRHLRTALGLHDNSRVILEVPSTCIDRVKTSDLMFRAAWYLRWRGRESLFYRDAWYSREITRHLRKTFFWRAYH
jgi:hypothetical protein